MFQFPALASYLVGWQSFRLPGCPIRKSMDQRIFAPPHSLSQLITSFIACKSLGIHRTPLNTFYQNTANLNQQRWIYLKLVLYLTLNRFLYSSVFTLLILNLLVELLYNMSKIVVSLLRELRREAQTWTASVACSTFSRTIYKDINLFARRQEW